MTYIYHSHLQADFTLEGFDRAMDVLVLFEPARGREPLSTLGADVTSGVTVYRSQMLRQLVRMRERVATLVARVGVFATVGGEGTILKREWGKYIS